MELKAARLILLVAPRRKEAFERPCALQDRVVSQGCDGCPVTSCSTVPES